MYFQRVISRLPADIAAVLAIVFLLLIPTHPFDGEESHWLERASLQELKEASELFKIYSVLKSEGTDLDDSRIWQISDTILQESRSRSLDPMLVLAVINVESSFEHEAVSAMGARGLMQIRPIVAHTLAKELIGKDSEALEPYFAESRPEQLDLHDPILNIKLGVTYLHLLKKSFRNLALALTAYNRGPTDVKNRLEEDEVVPLDYANRVFSAYYGYRKAHRQNQN